MTRQKEKPLVYGQGLCKTKNLLRKYSTKPSNKNQRDMTDCALGLTETAYELSEIQDDLKAGKVGFR